MTTANIKNTVIEKVKKMNSSDVKKIYGLMIEHNLSDSLFNYFDEIPEAHKSEIKSGINDLRRGKKQRADIFIKNFRTKYA
jgi:hypothetical protein